MRVMAISSSSPVSGSASQVPISVGLGGLVFVGAASVAAAKSSGMSGSSQSAVVPDLPRESSRPGIDAEYTLSVE
jgi:hypothetical protein